MNSSKFVFKMVIFKFVCNFGIICYLLYSQFTRITSIEQRRKYKTEFDNDYAEYRKLHAEVDQTSKRFEQLGKKLRNEKHNEQKYRVR